MGRVSRSGRGRCVVIWPRVIVILAAVAVVALAAALAWKQLRTQPCTPPTPEPALVAAKHRAEGRPGSDEQWSDLTATVPGMSQRALAEAWQAAQRANERLGGDDADLS